MSQISSNPVTHHPLRILRGSLLSLLAPAGPPLGCLGSSIAHMLALCSSLRYESVIATLCENLDSLDEPEARAAMIWIVGEYAERIDNADELLESFLEGFHDESTQVSHQGGEVTWARMWVMTGSLVPLQSIPP